MSRRLADLLAQIDCKSVQHPQDLLISGIEHDSRKIQSGHIFVAIRGSKHDGHDHIRDALQSGAAAIVAERPGWKIPAHVTHITVDESRKALADLACAFYDNPTERLFTVGVTGTKGKTSVTHLSAAVLGQEETEIISTLTNALQRGTDQTTPAAPEIQSIAWEALHAGKAHLILEVSAHALSQERVRGVDFDVAIFTNLSHDHLDYFRDLDSYLQVKLQLFSRLSPSAVAIVNRDDPVSHRVIAASKASVLTYGLTPEADIWAEEIELQAHESRSLVHTPKGSFRLHLHFPGIFYVQNALAAVAAGLVCELPLSLIRERLEDVWHIEGRLERFWTREGFAIVIDFAHSPDSLEKTLQTLKPFYRRLLTVFGCGGDSDRLKRPVMGAISGRLSDYTIITSDNPKGEEPEIILREIAAGLQAIRAPYEAIVNRQRAIQRALSLARSGDCILIAGKGHERRQIFKDVQVPFNDKAYLAELGAIAQESLVDVD